jgi:NitT/TauT family transport system substrate-binding protein
VAASEASPVSVRIGHFPNLTHAQALVAKATGRFQRALGLDAKVRWFTFNAGPSVIEAIFAGQLDVSYIGPGPVLNGHIRAKGRALKVVAGSAEGGAGLVARKGSGIRGPADLAGKRVATPQVGNTQDVALRHAIRQAGLAPREKGGKVWIVPMANPEIRDLFRKKELDAAWVPEPWMTLLSREAGGEVVLDERSIWPEGRFVTTLLIVSASFLEKHRELAGRIVSEHRAITGWIAENPEEARRVVNAQLAKEMGRSMDETVLAEAWGRVRFTAELRPDLIEEGARRTVEAGFLGPRMPNLGGLYDPGLTGGDR